MTTLRIAACNHWNGGGKPGRWWRRGCWQRLDVQLDLLRELDADIIFSTEAKYWLDSGGQGLRRARRRLGMRPHVARAGRHDCNLVIWTRKGRIRVRRTAHQERHPWWHALCAVEADIEGLDVGEEPVWLVAGHLSPFDPALRASEARAMSEFAQRWALLGGDFNDEGVGDRPTTWPPGYKQVRHEHLPGGTAAELLDRSGFVDVASVVQPDPADRESTAGFPNSPVRCDRFYESERLAQVLRPVGYGVLPRYPALSDHRILYADLEVA